MLRINYLCGRITNKRLVCRGSSAVVICSELTTFAVESPTIKNRYDGTDSCDLLRINYLCGRITNELGLLTDITEVVICSELTTFAVESPTIVTDTHCVWCCDLLRINYLCGRITNAIATDLVSNGVVICSELTTFAVESPTI